jgi:hypothetical protein
MRISDCRGACRFVVQFEHGESPGKVRVILWQDHLQGIRIGDFQVDGSDG